MLHLEWIPASASQRKSKVRHLHLEVEQGCCHSRGVQSKLTATDWLRLATELTATDSVSLARRSCAVVHLLIASAELNRFKALTSSSLSTNLLASGQAVLSANHYFVVYFFVCFWVISSTDATKAIEAISSTAVCREFAAWWASSACFRIVFLRLTVAR